MKPITLVLHVGAETTSVPLDQVCRSCDGPGTPCTRCDGSGFVLTDAGRTLARFVNRHGLQQMLAAGRRGR